MFVSLVQLSLLHQVFLFCQFFEITALSAFRLKTRFYSKYCGIVFFNNFVWTFQHLFDFDQSFFVQPYLDLLQSDSLCSNLTAALWSYEKRFHQNRSRCIVLPDSFTCLFLRRITKQVMQDKQCRVFAEPR